MLLVCKFVRRSLSLTLYPSLQFLTAPSLIPPNPFNTSQLISIPSNSFQCLTTPSHPLLIHSSSLKPLFTQFPLTHNNCITYPMYQTPSPLHSPFHPPCLQKRLKNKVLCDTIHLKVHLMCNMSVQVEVVLI